VGASVGGKQAELDAELVRIMEQITDKERGLEELLPEWEAQRFKETTEKRKLDEANVKLTALFAKQGRVNRFKTKAERDAFLRREIASIKAFQAEQTGALHDIKAELDTSRTGKTEVELGIAGVQGRIEDGRKRVKELADRSVALKEKQTELMEQRKDLWREDSKLDSLLRHANDELKTAERNLASMMDKVRSHLLKVSLKAHLIQQDTGMGLRAVDKIAERHALDGVYGPLYRLFEVTDQNFNTAVELTAGNRRVDITFATSSSSNSLAVYSM
jgi:structural maintenance of chromosome 3 (chondroitin sulfate proteoglycan 6)